MISIADIFQKYVLRYIGQFGETMPKQQRKALDDIVNCRTPEAGVAVFTCEKCAGREVVYLGCGNRHCPNCQHDKSRQWLERALGKVLAGVYFMVTFTVPAQLRRFLRSNQKAGFGAMFKASADTLKGVIGNKKYCGADLSGFFGVLHTWSRLIEYHPHIHYVVPGGGLDRQSGLWKLVKDDDYLAPVRTLSRLFKAKFRDEMRRLGLFDQIPDSVWRKDWNVNVQPVGRNTEGVLKYLASYVFRVAISDSRIVRLLNDRVTFTYTPSGTDRTETATLDVLEFMRRFLQHVLPSGFMKVRYYGFMGAGCRIPHEQVAAMAQLADSETPLLTPPKPEKQEPAPPPACSRCGGRLFLSHVWKDGRIVLAPDPFRTRLTAVQLE